VPWEALFAAFAESSLAVAVEGAVVRAEVVGQVRGVAGVVGLWFRWEPHAAGVEMGNT
jgi:hypothetical protein